MIPSQQSIMLDTALAFEHIIKNPRAGTKGVATGGQITWDSPEELEGYIKKLQSAADKLTSENRRLRKCHGLLTDKASTPSPSPPLHPHPPIYHLGTFVHLSSESLSTFNTASTRNAGKLS